MQEQERQFVRNDPDSLAPLQIERVSVEEEVASMNRGKALQLVLIAAGVGLCAIGVAFALKRLDTSSAYAAAAAGAERARTLQSDAFLACALPGVHPSQVTSADKLLAAVESSSERLGKGYARQLSRCTPKLDALVATLGTLSAPSEVSSRLESLRSAAADLARRWHGYREYLADPSRGYDYVQALPQIEKIALSWSAYEQRHQELETVLRARL